MNDVNQETKDDQNECGMQELHPHSFMRRRRPQYQLHFNSTFGFSA